MDDLLAEFLTESFENLDLVDQELVQFERNPNNKVALDRIFRLVHTVKGTCGFIGLERLEKLAHAAETLLGQFRDGNLAVTGDAVSLVLRSIDQIKFILRMLERHSAEPEGEDSELIEALQMTARGELPEKKRAEAAGSADDGATAPESSIANQTIRVDVKSLERMMTLVSELVLTRNQLMQMVRKSDNADFKVPFQRLSTITSDLQDSVMRTRMQPIGNAWAKLPRLVRDLSEELAKKITIEMVGAETELDRQVLELIKDPLVHMIRNSADHGLETPAERRAFGKPEQGRIKLSATHEGGYIVIDLTDDGRGLNVARIRDQIVRLGLSTDAEVASLTEAQIHQFVFHPGFSTADKVTNLSGRGVGLDVVRSNIEQLGGTITLQSEAGKGAKFTIKIPLTLTIVSALIVEASGQRYAIPQVAVTELVRARPGSDCVVEMIYETPVLRLRNRLLPLLRLEDVLGIRSISRGKNNDYVVICSVNGEKFGLIVTGIFDTEEIVVKPVASILRHIPIYCGSTILGDGSVVMIVDPHGIAAQVSSGVLPPADSDENKSDPANKKTSFLVFKAGGGEQKAVPLSLITRLEEVESSRIESCDGHDLLQYRGRLMPILALGEQKSVPRKARQPVLVISNSDTAVGLAVDQIIDIVEEHLDIEIAPTRPGLLGSAVINGRATEIIDVAHYVAVTGQERMLAALQQAGRKMKGQAA